MSVSPRNKEDTLILTRSSLTADKDDAGPDCGGVDLSVKFWKQNIVKFIKCSRAFVYEINDNTVWRKMVKRTERCSFITRRGCDKVPRYRSLPLSNVPRSFIILNSEFPAKSEIQLTGK